MRVEQRPIVLPVVILSGTSFYFLREDRGAIEQDAREQAQRLAPSMARAFASRIAELVLTLPRPIEVGRAEPRPSPACGYDAA